MKYLALLTGTLTLSFFGCDSIATKEKTDVEVAAALGAETTVTAEEWQMPSDPSEVEVDWLASFNDSTLEALVEEAQANNKDLQAAAANVQRARALAIQAGAALSPNVGLSAGGGGSGNLDNNSSGDLSVGLQVSWELDVWGRLAAGERAAKESFEATQADFIYSQHSIAANTAKAYFAAIEVNRQAKVVQDTLDALEETTRIVNVKFENGIGSSQDVALSKSDLASTRDQKIELKGSQRDASRSLELLLGRYPGAELEVKSTLPKPPKVPPAGLPSELLERRPDLIAAERRVAAAFNTQAQAKAAKLPAISLSSTIGGSSDSLSNILSPQNVLWQAGANLLAPIADGGKRDADIEIATAEQEQALALYGSAALNAFGEVERGLDQGVILSRREAQLQTAFDEATEAYRVAQLRYKEGETELLDALTIQKRVFAAESSLVSVQRMRLEQNVNLNLALGGGW
ncbi:MAG: NodT family efflux transporter outer membrane factor (OMF) lipoprotein [Verrucomicrobiales bacterium]|jgi:NodT family efflux transporter outer membrane factor (OMF) lipoprotein